MYDDLIPHLSYVPKTNFKKIQKKKPNKQTNKQTMEVKEVFCRLETVVVYLFN
jgi:hypothetical protein